MAHVRADGVREILSADQTAALAMLLLRAAANHPRHEKLLLKLHAIAAAQNLAERDVPHTGTADPKPTDQPPPESTAPGSGEPQLPDARQPLNEAPRGGSIQNPSDAQFRTVYSSGFVGPAGNHLGGLPDEDLQFREGARRGLFIVDTGDRGTPLAGDIGDRQTQDGADQNAFSNIQNGPEYDAGFVGPGINHLQPLGNEDYR
ncbi:MAG: hypothetical protein ACRCTI_05935, partial [Beijerinckiaceae bacterium]